MEPISRLLELGHRLQQQVITTRARQASSQATATVAQTANATAAAADEPQQSSTTPSNQAAGVSGKEVRIQARGFNGRRPWLLRALTEAPGRSIDTSRDFMERLTAAFEHAHGVGTPIVATEVAVPAAVEQTATPVIARVPTIPVTVPAIDTSEIETEKEKPKPPKPPTGNANGNPPITPPGQGGGSTPPITPPGQSNGSSNTPPAQGGSGTIPPATQGNGNGSGNTPPAQGGSGTTPPVTPPAGGTSGSTLPVTSGATNGSGSTPPVTPPVTPRATPASPADLLADLTDMVQQFFKQNGIETTWTAQWVTAMLHGAQGQTAPPPKWPSPVLPSASRISQLFGQLAVTVNKAVQDRGQQTSSTAQGVIAVLRSAQRSARR